MTPRLFAFFGGFVLIASMTVVEDNVLQSQEATTVSLHIQPGDLTPEVMTQFFAGMDLPDILPTDSVPHVVSKLAGGFKEFALRELAKRGVSRNEALSLEDLEYPYFAFIPDLKGKVVPNGSGYVWKGNCYRTVTTSVTRSGNDVEITLATKDPMSFCTETMVLATTQQFTLTEVVLPGTKTIKWNIENATSGDIWDLEHNGVRVFAVPLNIKNTLVSVARTAELFEPCASKPVQEESAQKNLDFLLKYRGLNMTKRVIQDVILNETDIHSGDFFGVMRLDGLDPMLAWAMGASTGHTTVALWGEDGQLYICESTATSSYWDINGIQKTPYREWIAKAKAASYNVFHLPLAPEYREKFNVTAAWEWFATVEGLDYGYNNMFWGWIDTPVKNYPCIPPDYSRCLTWDMIEVAFPVISRTVPKFQSFWDQAFNKRLGTEGLDFGGILQQANLAGLDPQNLPTIVEDDTWNYNLTRNGAPSSGPSMVCCAFVCHTWKAGGVFSDFGSDINCGEQTNWDDYAMAVFDKNYVRPQACVDADPDNILCQLLGEYSIPGDAGFNSKPPFAHIGERCPGVAPDYARPAQC